eukprot:jgi/Tetstr1/444490/TSEL_032371.t1
MVVQRHLSRTFDAGGVGGPACDYVIDFACVSSTTPTWGNDPRWCTMGIAATEAERNKLAVDRAPSAPVHGARQGRLRVLNNKAASAARRMVDEGKEP